VVQAGVVGCHNDSSFSFNRTVCSLFGRRLSRKLIGVLNSSIDNNERVRPDRGAFVPH
jgi:hypothetical protein